MLLFQTRVGPVVQHRGQLYPVPRDWNELLNDNLLHDQLASFCQSANPARELVEIVEDAHPPVGLQEVWGAGVTYVRSKTARMEESDVAGGGDFYDRVYSAERPELFLKATPHRVVGSGQAMHLRRDAQWIVPEPELTLVITNSGQIIGYTIGNDLSCRDLEGENPLYLPQAKTFDRCAGVGPAIFVTNEPLPAETGVHLQIMRGGESIFSGSTTLTEMRRSPEELVHYLFRDNSHPHGCLLMTGTGIVPPDHVSLLPNDRSEISIDGIGTLINTYD